MTHKPTLRFALAAVVAMLAGTAAAQPVAAGTSLQPLVSYSDWLSSRPNAADLRGKVVLVDIFTFACFNCQNVTPNLKALYRKHDSRLAIIGIHTPETSYESDRTNVVTNLARQGVVWPVAIDNDHVLWNAYDTEYWPTQLIFDKHGTLRKTVEGDSQDAVVDKEIDDLLAEN
jgi:thiol-disulfide isomerase/thioredoxin